MEFIESQRTMLEVCVDSVESGMEACQGGADRIELCGNLIIGGTTPELSLFRILKRETDIPINVMIRPRYGDFCYTEYEFEIMKQSIQDFINAGAGGFVFGILEPDGCLDVARMNELKDMIGNRRMTLHRCIDMCRDMEQALEDAIATGFDTILTSGGRNQCTDGMEELKRLHTLADGRIDIMAGSGVDADVIPLIHQGTGITSFHMSGKIVADSQMKYRKRDVSMGIGAMDEYKIIRTDRSAVARAKRGVTDSSRITA